MPALAVAANAGMRVPYTDFPAQFAAERDDILPAIQRVLEQGDFILGAEVEAFEREFAALCGARHAVGVASGTDALLLALHALGIGPGDEVITAPNSWVSTAASIALVGARPVFADVLPDFTLDPRGVEAAITPRTKAILPVHLTGQCADMAALGAIAQRHGLSVVEDAAQAVGAYVQGRRAGTFGAVGCFSLHPLKNLSAVGDAGILVTNDPALAQRLRLWRNHGLQGREAVVHWGLNSRLDTLQAAVLRCRLRRLSQITEQRRQNAARYRALLGHTVACPGERGDEGAVYHLFMIQTDQRDALKQFLAARGIDSKIHYPVPLHLQPCSRSLGYRAGDFPVAEAQAQRILSLPVHQHLSAAQIEHVAQTVLEFFRQRAP